MLYTKPYKLNTTDYSDYYNRILPKPSSDQWSLAVQGSHNASLVIAQGTNILEVVEVERFLNKKALGLTSYVVPNKNVYLYIKFAIDYITKKYNINQFENVLYENFYNEKNKITIQNCVNANNYIDCLHQYSHANNVFYQSSFNESIVFTSDGGGVDGFIHVFHFVRGKSPKFLCSYNIDFGNAYKTMGVFLGDITQNQNPYMDALNFPGKIMGLCSYGKSNLKFLNGFKKFFVSNWYNHLDLEIQKGKLTELGQDIGIDLHNQRHIGQLAYDLAATGQQAFEELLFEIMDPVAKKYKLPFCFSGGCALNILANTKIVERYQRELFVGPNPDDRGIPLGMMLDYFKPDTPFDSTYIGLPLLDYEMLPTYLLDNYDYNFSVLNVSEIANDIKNGKIIGVARGRSELGPRALGNRSILCDPCITDIKDVLNQKVKKREWYRPFAPVVRLEDLNKYFDWNLESRFMSFAVPVKSFYRSLLPGITHVDNTARVQTVTKIQNPFLYELLTELDKISGIGVLLNTSFNINNKPILNSVQDIFDLLKTTKLDGAVIEDIYVKKHDLNTLGYE